MTLYNTPSAPAPQSERTFLFVALGIMGFVVLALALVLFVQNYGESDKEKRSPANSALIGRSWGPQQATGEPNTESTENSDDPEAGSKTLWRPLSEDAGVEWLSLAYARPFKVSKIIIYETNSRDALYRITKQTNDYNEIVLWEKASNQGKPAHSVSNATVITLNNPEDIQALTLYLNTALAAGWNEIDAVGVEDVDGVVHWAVSGESSSTYADAFLEDIAFEFDPLLSVFPAHGRAWGPEQATGAVDSPIPLGDYRTAWASLTEDGQDEWLLLSYGSPVRTAEIHVYESFNPGALWKITAVDGEEETVIWEGEDPVFNYPYDGHVAKIALEQQRALKQIKLYVRSTAVKGWNEIDAVALVDGDGVVHWALDAQASSSFAEFNPVDLPQ